MKIDFQKFPDGLAPAIIQDAQTGVVLMLGFMDEAALAQTLAEGRVTFFSRSKQRLWTKGETSGHFLQVVELLPDCDADTLLIKVKPHGPVCHAGTDTCFGEENHAAFLPASPSPDGAGAFLVQLERTIQSRLENPVENSYVASLAQKGVKKIAQKVGEEAVELILEAQDGPADLFLAEAADLVFHLLVLLNRRGHSLAEVADVLKGRQRRN